MIFDVKLDSRLAVGAGVSLILPFRGDVEIKSGDFDPVPFGVDPLVGVNVGLGLTRANSA